VIEVRGLTKRFGRVVAVNALSFDVAPGRVTGFLGPNGSGKSTTLRCMLGLDVPDAGWANFDGRPFVSLDRPLTQVGALLDAGYVHPGRSARNHLRWMAASNGLPDRRVDEVLELVGLATVARSRTGTFSLGMRQRLGLAGVLLGDPQVVLLDEPANGLDPEGIRWIRDVLVHLAGQGRTVFVSSHQLSEIALMAQDLVVIGQGHLIETSTVQAFVDRHARRWVRVRTPQLDELLRLLTFAGRPVEGERVHRIDADSADVHGVAIEAIGERAAAAGIVLHELSPQVGSLEEAFLAATSASQEYRARQLDDKAIS
jgi:ABC-2 type transport system ATP-binding protein